MTKQERTTRARVWRALAEKIDRSGRYASGLCYELRSLRDGFEHGDSFCCHIKTN